MCNNIIAYLRDRFNYTNVLLLASIVVGSCMRLWNLARESLWGDEIFSAVVGLAPTIHDIVMKFMPFDVHPPLYYLILHGWIKVFGHTELALRLPSALASILGLFAMYQLTKRVFNKNVAGIATILLAFSTTALYYAQEARSYSFLLLFSTISTLLWLLLLQKMKGEIPRKELIYFTLSTILISYLHYFGFALSLFQFGYLLLVSLISKKNRCKLFFALGCLLISFVPWLLFHFSYLQKAAPVFWGKQQLFVSYFKELFAFFVFGGQPNRYVYRRIFLYSALVMFIVKIYGLRRSLTTKCKELLTLYHPTVALAAVAVVPYTIFFILSYHTPLMEARFFLILLPAFYLLIAQFILFVLPRRIAYTLVFLVWGVLAGIYFIRLQTVIGKGQWREAAQYIVHNSTGASKIGILLDLSAPTDHLNHLFYGYYFDTLSPRKNYFLLPFGEGNPASIKKVTQLFKDTTYDTDKFILYRSPALPHCAPTVFDFLIEKSLRYEVKEFLQGTVYLFVLKNKTSK
jgi:mannosyltransferase